MTLKKSIQDTKVQELTADLQRVHADFQNYRKRVDAGRAQATKQGELTAIKKLLPVIDTIERATAHIPPELIENQWVQGVAGLTKLLEKTLTDMGVTRIGAGPGTTFDPALHQAIQFDEESTGEQEIITEELQAGYLYKDIPLRHAMVNVKRT